MQAWIDKLRAGDGVLWLGISIALIVVVVVFVGWLIRILRPTLNMSGAPPRAGRVQRLAVSDAFPLDRDGRKLVIVRRDNVEHLLLIGGPNDLLVEANFTRSDRARGARPDAMPEGIETPLELPPVAPAPVLRPQAPAPMMPPSMPAAPPPRPQPVVAPRPPAAPVTPAPAVLAPVVVPASAAPPPGMAPQSARPASPTKSPDFDTEFEAAMRSMEQQIPAVRNAPPAPVPPLAPALMAAPVAPPSPPPAPSPTRAEPMSEMARRLSEVLQKPVSPQRPLAPSPRPAAPTPPTLAPPSAPPAPAPAKGAAEAEMDALEEEMARLLGRPGSSGKPGGV